MKALLLITQILMMFCATFAAYIDKFDNAIYIMLWVIFLQLWRTEKTQ